jgi:hypothetical protein
MTQNPDMRHALGRIEGQLTLVIEMLKSGDDRHERLDKRVRWVENKAAGYASAAAVVATLAAYLMKPH